ncbi:MAG TPA: phosphoribosylglycinamide formyltransferase [bacterium]|nr:phosphoribosylglycinamide formyltransferase [bacterium]HPN35973.1 phosphoribosylglycinamide formyltransferase [bacterium]
MADTPALAVAVFVSGRGSNVQAIQDKIDRAELNARIVLMISSSAKAGALEIARRHHIPAFTLTADQYVDEAAYSQALLHLLEDHAVRLIVLAGYLKKVPVQIVQSYRHRMINIHPALLPSFGGQGLYGRHVHEAVLNYGCKVSGATVHLVDFEYDTGQPLLQRCVPVQEEDTPETLAARVLAVEHEILPEAIRLFAENRIQVQEGRVRIRAERG